MLLVKKLRGHLWSKCKVAIPPSLSFRFLSMDPDWDDYYALDPSMDHEHGPRTITQQEADRYASARYEPPSRPHNARETHAASASEEQTILGLDVHANGIRAMYSSTKKTSTTLVACNGFGFCCDGCWSGMHKACWRSAEEKGEQFHRSCGRDTKQTCSGASGSDGNGNGGSGGSGANSSASDNAGVPAAVPTAVVPAPPPSALPPRHLQAHDEHAGGSARHGTAAEAEAEAEDGEAMTKAAERQRKESTQKHLQNINTVSLKS